MGAPEFAPVAAVAQQHGESRERRGRFVPQRHRCGSTVRWIVTGSYKRWAKRWVLVIAIAVVCIGNIDSIAIARRCTSAVQLAPQLYSRSLI